MVVGAVVQLQCTLGASDGVLWLPADAGAVERSQRSLLCTVLSGRASLSRAVRVRLRWGCSYFDGQA